MANIIDNMEAIEEEIRELILHSKSKRRTIFEPCSEDNIGKYLKAVQEEMTLHGVKYLFNQYEDLKSENIQPTLVKLTNATWELLLLHKDVVNNGQKLKDRNYALQQNNFYLNNLTEKQKRELKHIDDKMKQIEEEKRQLVLKMDATSKTACKAEVNAKRSKSQLMNREHELMTRLKKAERDNDQMKDRFHAGIFTSRVEARSSCIEEYKIRERKYKETIAKLQENNRQLIQEVLNLKEDLLLDEEVSSR